ncbi:MAG: hypothetical protein ABIQ16_12390 [Polyangiaceae bacterium]
MFGGFGAVGGGDHGADDDQSGACELGEGERLLEEELGAEEGGAIPDEHELRAQ